MYIRYNVIIMLGIEVCLTSAQVEAENAYFRKFCRSENRQYYYFKYNENIVIRYSYITKAATSKSIRHEFNNY